MLLLSSSPCVYQYIFTPRILHNEPLNMDSISHLQSYSACRDFEHHLRSPSCYSRYSYNSLDVYMYPAPRHLPLLPFTFSLENSAPQSGRERTTQLDDVLVRLIQTDWERLLLLDLAQKLSQEYKFCAAGWCCGFLPPKIHPFNC